jgi:hypothetical protein
VPRLDAREVGRAEAEDRRDGRQIGELALVHGAVGLGDEEEAVEHVLEHVRTVREHPGELAGIELEAGGAALGEVEEARELARVPLGHGAERAKGRDFGFGHDAVGPGHLGRERHQAGREGRLLARRAVAEDGAHGVDEGFEGVLDEARCGAADAAKQRHAPQHSRGRPERRDAILRSVERGQGVRLCRASAILRGDASETQRVKNASGTSKREPPTSTGLLRRHGLVERIRLRHVHRVLADHLAIVER